MICCLIHDTLVLILEEEIPIGKENSFEHRGLTCMLNKVHVICDLLYPLILKPRVSM
jgi:hypothetical protein